MAATPTLIILAGGASSRMWPIREKSLLRFGPEPLLVAQLKRYAALGFADAVIVANPENADDITALATYVTGMRVRVVVQVEPKGMGDAILSAEPELDPDQPIYINQIHDVVNDSVHEALLSAHAREPDVTFIAGSEREEYFPGGYLVVDGAGRITGIVEKPGAENRPSNLVNIVIHLYPSGRALFDALRAEYARGLTSDDHYERAMDALMKKMVFKVSPYRGPWAALKFPWHVLDVMNAFLGQIKGQRVDETAYIAPTATLVGDVIIGPGAKVFPGAAVVGPAYIGAGVVVGNNALVRQSMVLDRSDVGFTTEVARSYVADHCAMHACRVLDSVFAPHVNFSAGCTTANLRIDHGHVFSTVKGSKFDTGRDKFGAVIGEGAFISVDVMTMPGVKIGARAQVGPGMHVHHDLTEDVRAYVKQEIVIVGKEK
jgi:bifunctional UDP-N-acetylglucosamine pyrophosphorylase/glucosamine-1-phosphate N-acetyltransferase